MKQRIAFDLDETLGTAMTDGKQLLRFHLRHGCCDLLRCLQQKYQMILWTASNRSYLTKVLQTTLLAKFFAQTYAWEDMPQRWKDIRLLDIDYLVDDSKHHQQSAPQELQHRYIVVPAYGSICDTENPQLWIQIIYEKLGRVDI